MFACCPTARADDVHGWFDIWVWVSDWRVPVSLGLLQVSGWIWDSAIPRYPWPFPGYRSTSSAAESCMHLQNFTLLHDLYHFQGSIGAQV